MYQERTEQLFIVVLAISAFICFGQSAFPQTSFVTVSGTKIVNLSGTPASNATMCGELLLAGQSFSVKPYGGGQTTQTAVCVPVTNGAFSLQLPDTSSTTPANACVAMFATDNTSGSTLLSKGYECVQPTSASGSYWCTGTTCNFDLYVPTLPAIPTVQTGPQGVQGIQGPVGPGGTTSATGTNGAFTVPGALTAGSLGVTGNTQVTGTMQASTYNSTGNSFSLNGIPSMNRASINTAVDGDVVLASGYYLFGLFQIEFTGPNRVHHIMAAVSAIAYSASPGLTILTQNSYNGQAVITNLRIMLDASSFPQLVATLGNRNAGTSLTVTAINGTTQTVALLNGAVVGTTPTTSH